LSFATQSKIYEYKLSVDVAKEELTGFEVRRTFLSITKTSSSWTSWWSRRRRSKIFGSHQWTTCQQIRARREQSDGGSDQNHQSEGFAL